MGCTRRYSVSALFPVQDAHLVEQRMEFVVRHTYQGLLWCRCAAASAAAAPRRRAAGIEVGSCCQGRWCVILSPLCLLPVGQGLLEQGVVDSTEWRGGEGSQQARKESGQTHSATAAGQRLGYLAPLLFHFIFSSMCFSFSPAQSSDSTNAGKQLRAAFE